MVDTSALFKPVDPSEVPSSGTGGRRARVSGPILDAFIASGQVSVQLDADALEAEDKDKAIKSLYSSLGSYAVNNRLPVEVFIRQGTVYLRRLDLDDQGNEREWTPKERAPKAATTNGSATDEVEPENEDEYEDTPV